MRGKRLERRCAQSDIGHSLPAIDRDEPTPFAPSTTQIDHKPLFSGGARQRRKPLRAEAALRKQPARHDDLFGSGVEPELCVIGGDAPAKLHAAGPGGERARRRIVIAGAKLDDMAA